MKYTKKPIEIEAVQINANPTEIKEFVGDSCQIEYYTAAYEAGQDRPMLFVTIHTLEGDMQAKEGDYIIKGVKGEFYPCRKDIFEETYEAAK
jgi:hypothetical protein